MRDKIKEIIKRHFSIYVFPDNNDAEEELDKCIDEIIALQEMNNDKRT